MTVSRGTRPAKCFPPRRSSVLLLIFALPLLLGAKGKKPEAPVIYREGFLEVVSSDNVSVADCKDAVKMLMAAWKFDLSVMNWAPTKEMNRPLTLRVQEGKKEGVRASANQNGNRFTMYLWVLKDSSAPLTFAHELGHTQAFRVLGEHVNKVPHYFVEGHGLIMNRLYADHLRISSPEDWIGHVRWLMSVSPETVRTIYTDNSFGDPENDPKNCTKMEQMGVYFVEYMRTRVKGKGIPDMVPKMARVFELVGRGKNYGQAFKEVYGVWASDVASEIVELFQRTESNPAERLKGTRFEVAAKAVADKSRNKGDGE